MFIIALIYEFNFEKTEEMKITKILMIAFIGTALLTVSCKKEGCTDPLASNYDKKANKDDKSCKYGVLGDDDGVIGFELKENITTPMTLKAGNIAVCGTINVTAALTIEPGCKLIMCAGSSIIIKSEGSISAIGTPSSPIIIKGKTASPGFWSGIEIRSNNPNNKFNYVTVSDGGGYWASEHSTVFITGSSQLSMTNSTISGSLENGIYMGAGSSFPAFANNTFANNMKAGLNITASQAGSIDAASKYNISNGEDFISVRGETITSNRTWPATTTPYLVRGDVSVEAGLILSPGSTVLLESKVSLIIKETGYLTAMGTVGAPIMIQGRYATPGYWGAIDIRSNNPNNKFEYVMISDGGSYWSTEYTSLYVSKRLEIDNCSIKNSNSWGMIVGGSGQIWSSGAVRTDAAGVMAYNTISGNGVGADADCVGGGCTVWFK